MEKMTLAVKSRHQAGKGSSRRLRRLTGHLPAIIYGGSSDPQPISIEHKELIKLTRHETFFSQVLRLEVDGKAEEVIVKALQRHPYKDLILHVDFQRVDAETKITVNIPVHLINEDQCIGVRNQGGVIFRDLVEIEITCLPADLPESIEIDVANLEIGHSIHLKEVPIPENVQITALLQSEEHDTSVVRVSKVIEQPIDDDQEAIEGNPEEESEN